VDSHFSHFAWREQERSAGGIGKIGFPLVSDLTKKIATDYHVLINGSVALRGLYLIDKEGIVRHQVVNDLPLGRSTEEALRIVDALQSFEKDGEVCPADFHRGAATMKADQNGLVEYAKEHLA